METLMKVLLSVVVSFVISSSGFGIYCFLKPFWADKKKKASGEKSEANLITYYDGYEFLSAEGEVVMLDTGDITYTAVIRTDLNALEQCIFCPGLLGNQGMTMNAFRDRYSSVIIRGMELS